MARLKAFLKRLQSLWRPGKVRDEIGEEFQFHLEQQIAENLRRGMSPEDSRRDAERRFGALARIREEGYEARSISWVESLMQDSIYGLRLMRRNPGFSAAAMLTLALGIGANTAIFSVVNAVLLRPLPYPDSGRLVVLGEKIPSMQMSVSYSNFKDWEAQDHVFESLGARRYSSFNLTGAGDPERVRGMMVSAGYFPALGVQPVQGRLFHTEEDQDGGQPVVVLSSALWVRRFGADSNIAGKSIDLDNKSYTVVGVLPSDFAPGTTAQLYVPLSTLPEAMKTRDNHPGIYVIGRRKPGVSEAQAQSEMNRIASALEKEYPLTNAHHQVTMTPMKDWIVGDAEYPLLTILAAVTLLLLIACVNVSNLFLARAAARKKEVSVRIALGARRSRLVRQMLAESTLVSIASGAMGLLLAYWGVRMLVALKPSNLPRLAEIEIDKPVLLFTLGLSLLTAIIFGLVPALRSSRIGISDSLKDGGTRSTSGREHQRMRYALVISEYALAVVLLVAAGLLVRSFARLLGVNPAFDPHQLLTFSVDLPAEYQGESRLRFFDELQRRAQALPEVQSVAYASGLPLIGTNESSFRLPGQNEMEGYEAVEYDVGPGYFEAMRIHLLKGRAFAPSDRGGPLVVVVDPILERTCFGGNAVGKFISRGPLPPIQIIGVVEHVANYGLAGAEPVGPQYYFSLQQIPAEYLSEATGSIAVVVRTRGEPAAVTNTMRRLVTGMDARQPIGAVETMGEAVAESIAPLRFSTILLGLFAAVALLLASVGIYGVIAYSINQRLNEIGIRMALGATTGNVLAMVLGQGFRLVAIGIALGVAGSLLATRTLASQLYGIRATDPATFAAIAGLMAAVALLAIYIPARRATRVDPLLALRRE